MSDTDRIRRPEERVVQVAAPMSAPIEFDAGRPSIAVLPFANMSGDPEQEYFADGMVEEIITGLSRIRWLDVIARNSSFIYKGKPVDVREVGRTLAVRYVLEGSVRKASDRVRITGQLIEAATGGHLWADKFDGKLEDIFDFQDRITMSVVSAIEPNVLRAEMERARRKRPDNLTAYDFYLRALAHLHERRQDLAVELVDQALALDPKFVEAHGVAARCHSLLFQFGGGDESERKKALAHVQAVQTLGTEDSATLAYAGIALNGVGADHTEALGLINRALAQNPSSAMSLGFGAVIHAGNGSADIALEWAERSLRLSPLDPLRTMAWLAISTARAQKGDFDVSLAAAREVLQINARIIPAHMHLIANLVRLGRTEEARAGVQRVHEIFPELRISQIKGSLARLSEYLRIAGLPE